MELDKQYAIQFSGLKEGKHTFNYTLKKQFFDDYLNQENDFDVTIELDVVLEKLSTMMVFYFSFDGIWQTVCDRCGDDMEQYIIGENKMFVKFGNEDNANEEVVVLPHNEYEINIAPFIYEFFLLNLPSRNIHKEGLCNQDVLDKLEKLSPSNESEETNPIWDKLKDLN